MCDLRSLLWWVRCVGWLCAMGGVLSFCCWGFTWTLGLFELVSSSCYVSPRSSLLPLMLSPSPSSYRVKSRDTSTTSPSGVFTLSVVSAAYGSTSGSCISVWARSGCAPMLDVSWRGTVVFGNSTLGLSGSLAALLLSFSARAAACATSSDVVFVSGAVSPAYGRTSGSCVTV